jgi:phosphoglycerate kinase
VVVAKSLKQPVCRVVPVQKVPSTQMILDLGPETIASLHQRLQSFSTVVWNGPVGAFEYRPFDVGSISIARSIAALTEKGMIKSIAGGGDVLAALSYAGLQGSFTYLSTAGGAFLEWLEGAKLPGVEALTN